MTDSMPVMMAFISTVFAFLLFCLTANSAMQELSIPAIVPMAVHHHPHTEAKVCGPGSHTFSAWCTGPGWWQSLSPAEQHAWVQWARH